MEYCYKSVIENTINFCSLCLSEKIYIIKSLNDPNLLNKKYELINTCCHQSKLLLRNFKRNRYSERSDTMNWYLVLILAVLYLRYVVMHCAIYWHIHHLRIACYFVFGLYNIKSFKVFYSLIMGWSAILKGLNNLYYIFCFFRSIVKCVSDDCVSMKL